MTTWTDLIPGSHVSMALLQLDIAGSSQLVGSTDQIAEAKAILRKRVERTIADYDGVLFAWPGDGGAFMFLTQSSADYSNIVLAGIMILNSLESINKEILLRTNLTQNISLRVSCDQGILRYEADPSAIHGDFLNKFLKHERAISLTNALTITERIFNQLPKALRDSFAFFKDSIEVNSRLFKLVKPGNEQTEEVDFIPRDNIIDELRSALNSNNVLRLEVEVVRLLSQVPRLNQIGVIEVARDKHQAAEAKLREKATKNGKNLINDPHAVVIGEPAWNDDPIVFNHKTVDFIGLSILRDGGFPVPVLSASVVALCPQKRELYLHRRSALSETYPNGLHTIGGAYMPPGFSFSRNEVDLVGTAQAEFREETNMNFLRSAETAMLLAKEPSTGFIQLVLLGVITTPEEVDAKADSWEGNVVTLASTITRQDFGRRDWVPTGLAHLTAWLGLEAPPLSSLERFDGLSARELFMKSVAKLLATGGWVTLAWLKGRDRQ